MIYYNECDPFAVDWLRELIKAGHIADGHVDNRSIVDVTADDLKDFTQCHFFAGIGVWSYALKQAGWPDDRAVWTGSCPCQPFSASGKKKGFDDERHLWPAWFNLIAQCRPATIFGEQVASALSWLDLVQADLEDANYAFAPFDLCAAGVGAPHIRQRLYFVADTNECHKLRNCGSGNERVDTDYEGWRREKQADGGRASRIVADTNRGRLSERSQRDSHTTQPAVDAPCWDDTDRCGVVGELADTHDSRPQGRRCTELSERPDELLAGASGASSFWTPADWLPCTDHKYRPVEPGTFPLAHGATSRVGRLRGYGNALCAPLATTFIEAYLDTLKERA